MSEDAALIAQAQSGDRKAFQRLLELHYDRIYRMAYHFTGHKDDAADIAQEVCLKLVDKLRSFRGESNFTTWLYRMTLYLEHSQDFSQNSGLLLHSKQAFRRRFWETSPRKLRE